MTILLQRSVKNIALRLSTVIKNLPLDNGVNFGRSLNLIGSFKHLASLVSSNSVFSIVVALYTSLVTSGGLLKVPRAFNENLTFSWHIFLPRSTERINYFAA